jgi:hypothetical protein
LPVFLPTILGPNIKIYPNPFIAQFTVAISREFSNYEVRLYTTTGREIPCTVWRHEQSLTVQSRVFEQGLLIAMMYIDGVLYAKNVVAQ